MEDHEFGVWLDYLLDDRRTWLPLDTCTFSIKDGRQNEMFTSADIMENLLGEPLPPPKRQCTRATSHRWHEPVQFPPQRNWTYAIESSLSQCGEPTTNWVPVIEPVHISTMPEDSSLRAINDTWHQSSSFPWKVSPSPFVKHVPQADSSPLIPASPPVPDVASYEVKDATSAFSVRQEMESAVGPVTVTFMTPQLVPIQAVNPPPSGRRKREKNAHCEICNKRFESRYKLKIHMNCHTGERPFVCDVCGKGFMRSHTLSAHRRTHQERRFSCPTCNRIFSRSPERLIHLLLRVCTRSQRTIRRTTSGWHCDFCSTGNIVRPEQHHCGRLCPVCRQDFDGQRDHKILTHVRSCHPEFLKTL